MAQDKNIQCADCGNDFTFSASEQEFFSSKGFTNEPKRCPACRQTRKQTRGGSAAPSAGGSRQMFPAVCAACGRETQVPFEPRNGRPVYCSDCFAKSKSTY
jgi:CxxC-x17-CxxC domain-containing protein